MAQMGTNNADTAALKVELLLNQADATDVRVTTETKNNTTLIYQLPLLIIFECKQVVEEHCETKEVLDNK